MYGLDLFSGIGGITKALEGYVTPVAYCENDRYAQGVLLSRMATGMLPIAPIWDDVKTLTGEALPPIDIIYGGFPCQDISVAGCGAGLEGERSGLFFEIARLVGEIRPSFVFLENVPAITTRGGCELLQNLPASGMTVDGTCFQLQTWVRTIAGKDGGYWPTPDTVSGGTSGHLKSGSVRRPTGSKIQIRLQDVVINQRFWPTPRAEERGQYQRDRGVKGKERPTLTGMVKMWPTPTTQDAANNGGPSQFERNSLPLNAAVKKWATPTARAGQQPGEHGQGGQNLATQTGGSLNPVWVEWLMNYPSGWTALEDWAIAWFRPKRAKPSKD